MKELALDEVRLRQRFMEAEERCNRGVGVRHFFVATPLTQAEKGNEHMMRVDITDELTRLSREVADQMKADYPTLMQHGLRALHDIVEAQAIRDRGMWSLGRLTIMRLYDELELSHFCAPPEQRESAFWYTGPHFSRLLDCYELLLYEDGRFTLFGEEALGIVEGQCRLSALH